MSVLEDPSYTQHRVPKMLDLPNEIYRQIAEVLEPATCPEDLHLLLQLRLVNRAFSAFATTVLFRNFHVYHIGSSMEDVDRQLRTLEKSDLRARITGLNIDEAACVPSDKIFKGNLIASLKRLPFVEEIEILGRLEERLKWQLRSVCAAFGPTFRFNSVAINKHRGALASAGKQYAWVYRGDRFLSTVMESLRQDCFACLTSFTMDFKDWDEFQLLLRKATQYAERDPRTTFLKICRGLRELKFGFTKNLKFGGADALLIGKLLAGHCPLLDTFSLHIHNKEVRFGTIFDSSFERNIDPSASSASIRSLSLAGFIFFKGGMEGLWFTIRKLPNLTRLDLRFIRYYISSGSDPQANWAVIFSKLDRRVPNLDTIYFENLDYEPEESDYFLDDEGLIISVECRVVLQTFRQEDINALMALRKSIETRRANKGLEKDLWLAGFVFSRDTAEAHTL